MVASVTNRTRERLDADVARDLFDFMQRGPASIATLVTVERAPYDVSFFDVLLKGKRLRVRVSDITPDDGG